MVSGWTGGQYSVYRVLLAVVVAGCAMTRADALGESTWMISIAVGLPASAALALGWRDRGAAGLLAALLGFRAAISDHSPLDLSQTASVLCLLLLVFHIATPPRPYGSWAARGRTDPAGDWRRPDWIGHAAWAALAALHLGRGVVRMRDAAFARDDLDFLLLAGLGLSIELVFAAALIRVRWRPAAWWTMTIWRIGWFAAFGGLPGAAGVALLHLLACEPTSWWPGRPLRARPLADLPARLFYDGDCGLCHRSVRFILAEEAGTPLSLRLRFAPLESETFEARVANIPELEAPSRPDSIVLELEDGSLALRSTAALEIASRLGGLWRALAIAAAWLPLRVLDFGYDRVAAVRKRLFAAPNDLCPILPDALRARFDP